MAEPADTEGTTQVDPVPPAVAPIVERPAVEAPAGPPREPDIYPMSFTGTGSEYFRIWIVNLALTILTLGVYSAWAKVRRLQYFYRHTRLASSGFDYHGDPFAIFKGRVIGGILFGLYSVIGYVQFGEAILILVTLALLIPWLLARSLKFRLHNSSYRGIRFGFSGSTRSAYWVFLGLPLATLVSLFTLGPLWHHRIKRYQFAHASYGRTPFTFRTETGEFYITYVLAAAIMFVFIVVMVIAAVIVGIGAVVASGGSGAGQPPPLPLAAVMVMIAGYATAAVAMQAITTARLHNAVWNRTRLAAHGFVCEVSWSALFGIQWTNLLATVLTLGLFRPFAQVRLARYFAGTFMLVPSGALADMLAADSEDVSAVGEETAGFFDLDIGF